MKEVMLAITNIEMRLLNIYNCVVEHIVIANS